MKLAHFETLSALGFLTLTALVTRPARAADEGQREGAAAADPATAGNPTELRDKAKDDAQRARGGGPPTVAGTPNNGVPDLKSPEERANAQALTATGVVVSAELGYGTASTDGLGIGARGGYIMRNRVWIGGVAEYNFGRSITVADIKSSSSRFIIGPEVGYVLNTGPVVVRPYVSAGLGIMSSSARSLGSTTLIDTSDTTAKLYVLPGVVVQVPIGGFFVGADGRILVMQNVDTSIGLFGLAGFRL